MQHRELSDSHAASFSELVERRVSTRAFLPDPVPRAEIERALALACGAPSNCNTQPWLIAVASGAVRDHLAAAISEAMHCSARLFDDGLIDPRDSRRVLLLALQTCLEARGARTRGNTFGVARF